MQELGCGQYATLILAFPCLLMSLLLQYGSGWESRCFLFLWHLSCEVVVSTLTLSEITFLVIVLVQSAHVDTMHAGVAAEAGEEQRIFAMKTEFVQLVVSFLPRGG